MPARKKSPYWAMALSTVAADCQRGIVQRWFYVNGRRTSCRLDAATWEALCDVAQRERVSIDELCTTIAAARPAALSRTVAIRAWLLSYFRRRTMRTRQVH
jgi:predicted DNA-binding ribbon-helix-helix protein